MDRNIYLPPYFPSLFLCRFTFPSLHGHKYLPASLLSPSLSLWIYLSQPTWTEISTCLPPFLALSLWIFLFQPTWTEISTCLPTFPLSFFLDLPLPAYMKRNIYLPPYFPSPILSWFTFFPSLHRQKYLPSSLLSLSLSLLIYLSQSTETEISTCLSTFPLSFSLDLPFSAYMDRNIYLPPSFPSFFLSISFPSLHGQKYLPASLLSLALSLYFLSQPTWTELSTCLPLPFSLDLPFRAPCRRCRSAACESRHTWNHEKNLFTFFCNLALLQRCSIHNWFYLIWDQACTLWFFRIYNCFKEAKLQYVFTIFLNSHKYFSHVSENINFVEGIIEGEGWGVQRIPPTKSPGSFFYLCVFQ